MSGDQRRDGFASGIISEECRTRADNPRPCRSSARRTGRRRALAPRGVRTGLAPRGRVRRDSRKGEINVVDSRRKGHNKSWFLTRSAMPSAAGVLCVFHVCVNVERVTKGKTKASPTRTQFSEGYLTVAFLRGCCHAPPPPPPPPPPPKKKNNQKKKKKTEG